MSPPDVPLYLHFLDRELGRSINSTVAPETSERIIKYLLVATNSPLYCGLSLLWESLGIDASVAQLCRVLIRSGVLNTVSLDYKTCLCLLSFLNFENFSVVLLPWPW